MRYSKIPVNYSFLLPLLSVGLSILLLGCSSQNVVSSPSAEATETAPSSPVTTLQPQPDRAQFLPVSAQAEIAEVQMQFEVARTPQQQAKGLMFRPALPADRGMLFVFETSRPVGFWMRNVPVALDMVFMQDGEVKFIASEVPPCTTPLCPTYGPNTPVNQVLELRGGRAAELGLAVGDRIDITFLESEDNPQN